MTSEKEGPGTPGPFFDFEHPIESNMHRIKENSNGTVSLEDILSLEKEKEDATEKRNSFFEDTRVDVKKVPKALNQFDFEIFIKGLSPLGSEEPIDEVVMVDATTTERYPKAVVRGRDGKHYWAYLARFPMTSSRR